MACPSGNIAILSGAITDTEGCQSCSIGEYSSGGNSTSCNKMNCQRG